MNVFVTGTDTDVGKTFCAAAICRGMELKSLPVAYWKPIQSGTSLPESIDRNVVSAMAPSTTIVPTAFNFERPLSPDQAAHLEQAPEATLEDLLKALPKVEELCTIEGAGGLYVPFNQKADTWIDFLSATFLPTLLVARTGLGTINHTSLSIRAIEQNGTPLLGVLLSGESNSQNLQSLQRLHPNVAFHEIPHVNVPKDANHATDQWDKLSLNAATFVLDQLEAHHGESEAASWVAENHLHSWHPYTQHQIVKDPLPLVRAKGIYVYTNSGERLVDGNSSWWVNTIGHGRKEIGDAIRKQQATMDHVIFAGATHQPAAKLSKRITDLAGSGLTRAFYSDNGSTAVEVALKMAFQSFANRGETKRNTFLAFRGSYHGDTFGAMSVGSSDGFHGPFSPLLFKTMHATPPTHHKSHLCPNGSDDYGKCVDELRATLAEHHQKLAGVIIEPLVQGASSMLMQPIPFLKELEAQCQTYGLPLIFDEVFTGLGRVGAAFAFQRGGVSPDIICLAKGLTGGTMPLSLTLAKESFFEAFLSDDKAKALLHGHSYTGNAIACSAALATLDLYENEGLAERACSLEAKFSKFFAAYSSQLNLQNPRSLGAIMAFELPGSGFGDYFNSQAQKIPAAARKNGLFLRPLGNTLYCIPPLCITDGEADHCLEMIAKTVSDLN
jgi:adenosylmethionine-8-amino-7-oxononanoate transaminase/dethiobiotin synthase